MKYIVKVVTAGGDEAYIGEVDDYADIVDSEAQAKRFDKMGDAKTTLTQAKASRVVKSGEVVGVNE